MEFNAENMKKTTETAPVIATHEKDVIATIAEEINRTANNGYYVLDFKVDVTREVARAVSNYFMDKGFYVVYASMEDKCHVIPDYCNVNFRISWK